MSDTAQVENLVEIETLAPNSDNRITAELRQYRVNEDAQLRVDPFSLTTEKVAIVGFTKHRQQAFELGDDFELWGLNELYRYEPIEKFHRWFEVHPRSDFEKNEDGQKHLKDLNDLDIPVYMHQTFGDIRPSVEFPKTDIEEELGSQYFTSSPAWMFAMAISMGAKEIHVYGVDMAQDTEYAEQRNCCEYWIGYARAKGIKVHIPETSDLCKAIGQYGFGQEGSLFRTKLEERIAWLHEQDNSRLTAMRALQGQFNEKKTALRTEFETKDAGLEAEFKQVYENVAAERNQIVGAINDCEYWKRSWSVGGLMKESAVPDRTADAQTGVTQEASDGDRQPK